MSNKISGSRKALHYFGIVLMILGFIMFFSNFFMGPFGGSSRFYSFHSNPISGFASRGIGGFILIAAGAIMMKVGRSGLAGSGVILDPEKAREDLEPWNRSKGGMINDTLEEIDLAKSVVNNLSNKKSESVVKIRCQSCKALNDEDAKFCKECGNPL